MEKQPEKEFKKSFEISIDEKKAKSHKKILIEGINVYFPYKPYQEQIKYMTNIIQTLKAGGNISSLESPAGTGKTLCLLCSVLGWVKESKNEIRNIYYCAKTISQINNVLNELQKTCYKIRSSFLSPRKFACLSIAESAKLKYDSTILSDMCKNDMLTCQYHRFFDNFKENKSFDKKIFYKKYDNLTDIEDLLKGGKKDIFCPYFFNINKTKDYSNITFMSYHYVLNPFVRNKLNIIEENAIIILDEAHNICNVFESLFTKKIDEFILIKIQDSLQHLLNKINKEEIDKIYYNEFKKNPLSEFRDKINDEINKIKVFISKLNTVRNKINKDEIYICTINDFKNLFFKKFEYNFYSRIINSIDEIILNSDYTPYSSDLYYKNKDKCNSDISEYTAIKKDLKKMKLFLSLLMSVTEKNANFL